QQIRREPEKSSQPTPPAHADRETRRGRLCRARPEGTRSPTQRAGGESGSSGREVCESAPGFCAYKPHPDGRPADGSRAQKREPRVESPQQTKGRGGEVSSPAASQRWESPAFAVAGTTRGEIPWHLNSVAAAEKLEKSARLLLHA